ncbi:hypothetical protein SAMN05421681_101539 [Lysobacter enzymogenes]|nr:hypothetical protein SAMN05421681_101539 [Lysobacter enzymogenes]
MNDGSAARAGAGRSVRMRRGAARALVLASCLPASALATAAAAACAPPGDQALAAKYTTAVTNFAAPSEKQLSTLQMRADGRFRWYDLPPLPYPEIAGCWRRSGDTVVLVLGAADGGDGVKRSMPVAWTQADLNQVRREGVQTIQQAVDAGLLAAGRVWAHQDRKAGEPVRVKLYEPTSGAPPGDAKVSLRLRDGRIVEGAAVPDEEQVIDNRPGPSGGEYLFASLPADAAVQAIGIRFPNQPDRPRWVSVEDRTKLLYMIEFDARATASLFGGTMTLIVNADGSLSPALPDRGEPFVRVP